jgi:hypothetical protein
MNLLELLFWGGNIIMATYLVGVLIAFGMTKSISATFYVLPKGLKWMFKAALIGYSIPLMIVAFESTWIAMSGLSIIFTALAADSRRHEDIEDIHLIGSVLGIGLTMIGFILTDKFELLDTWWIAVVQGAFTIFALIIKMRFRIYFIELLAIILSSFGVCQLFL